MNRNPRVLFPDDRDDDRDTEEQAEDQDRITNDGNVRQHVPPDTRPPARTDDDDDWMSRR
jgi:hypothetical protein